MRPFCEHAKPTLSSVKPDFRRGGELAAILLSAQIRDKELLLEGNMPLKAISDFCGFENPNSLRKFFRAHTGKTMTEWRESI